MGESWLRTYLRYTDKQEAPELFHFWVGVSLISAALGRKCWINRGYWTIYPNFFVVLVAGSGRCRKTTAIQEIGAPFVLGMPGVITHQGKSSTEKFVTDVNWEGPEHKIPPSIFVVADELSAFLARDSQGEKLIDVLTKLFDCPKTYPYKTLSRGTVELRDVYLTILAGTQPPTIARILPDSAFGGGLSSRIIWVYQRDTPKRNPWPVLSVEEIRLKQVLRERLEKISLIEGPFDVTPDAIRAFSEWYMKIEGTDDVKTDGFVSRKGEHVLKLACVLRASQGEGMDIQDKHVLEAIRQLNIVESTMVDVFSDVDKDPEARKILDLILRALHRAGQMGLQHSVVLKKAYPVKSPDFKIAIDTLMQNGMIAPKPGNSSHFYVCNCDECRRVREG